MRTGLSFLVNFSFKVFKNVIIYLHISTRIHLMFFFLPAFLWKTNQNLSINLHTVPFLHNKTQCSEQEAKTTIKGIKVSSIHLGNLALISHKHKEYTFLEINGNETLPHMISCSTESASKWWLGSEVEKNPMGHLKKCADIKSHQTARLERKA